MYRRRPQRIHEVRTNTPDTIRCIWISGHPWTEVSTTFHMSYMSYVSIIKCLLSFSSVNFFLFTSIRLTYVHKEQTEDIQPSSMSATTIPTESFWEKQQHTHSTKMFDFTTIANRLKSLSQRKSCKIQIFVHKQGWPILIIFGGLEGLCTSIPNILYFLSEIQNGRRTGRHLDFPILGLKCPWKYQTIDTFYAVIFL